MRLNPRHPARMIFRILTVLAAWFAIFNNPSPANAADADQPAGASESIEFA